MRKVLSAVLMVLAALFCSHQGLAATYYVNSATGDDVNNDGLSWANAFDTITNAVAVFKVTNAVVQGGHLILVTNAGSDYSQYSVSLTASSGTPGNPNVLRGLNLPKMNWGSASGQSVYLAGTAGNRTHDLIIDGLHIGRGEPGVTVRYADESVIFKNCVFEGYYSSRNQASAIWLREDTAIAITNCVFYGWVYSGLDLQYGSSTADVRNCIFMGNALYGVDVGNANAVCDLRNCAIYGNGGGSIYYNGTIYDGPGVIGTDTEVYAGSGRVTWTNCVNGNPGLANYMGDLKFTACYQNSPAHNGGEGGTGMGPMYTNRTIVAVGSPTTYYVSPSGSGADGLSWTTAWTTLAAASATAVAGDTVVVGTGTYSEELWITNGGSYISSVSRPVVYRAQGDNVVIDSSLPINLYGVGDVTVEGFRAVASGAAVTSLKYSFMNTVTNCDLEGGTYGVRVYATLRNTYIDSLIHGASGAGVYLRGGFGAFSNEPMWFFLKRCRIYSNGAQGYYDTTASGNRIHSCHIYNNSYSGIQYQYSSYQGGGFGQRFLVYNSAIYSNGFGGGTYNNFLSQPANMCGMIEANYGAHEVYNCTFYGNNWSGLNLGIGDGYAYNCIFAGNGGCGVQEGPPYGGNNAQDIEAKNCLFWNNGMAYWGTGDHHFHDLTGEVSTPTITTNVLSTAAAINSAPSDNGAVCEDNIVADPMFVNTAANDYRLRIGSPAIDQADPALMPTTFYYFPDQSQDVYGNPRTKLTEVDIGAAEYQPWSGTIMLIR